MSDNPATTSVHGHVADGWHAVADTLSASLARGDDVGASVAVYHRGQRVVDIAGGAFDESGAVYGPDSLQLVFSTTKGIASIAVAMCAQRGLIDYDEKVATYWPEFAAGGKDDATVAQLLSHQCGLITIDGLTLAEALDRDLVTERLAAGEPEWPIGSGHGYHALTFGWLAGELVRRVDGRTMGQFVADEISGPLGVDLWIGLPESEEPRVSPLIGGIGDSDEELDPEIKALMDQVIGPGTRGGRALSLSGAFAVDGAFNRRDVHAAEIPAANGISNAGALAKVYAATLGPVDGVQLLDDATRDRVRAQVTPADEPDLCLLMPTTFGMGFMTHGMFTPYAGPGSYGHPGAGGSVAFAQPERDLAFAYVMNKMAANLAGDLRAQQLIEAAVGVIDAQR